MLSKDVYPFRKLPSEQCYLAQTLIESDVVEMRRVAAKKNKKMPCNDFEVDEGGTLPSLSSPFWKIGRPVHWPQLPILRASRLARFHLRPHPQKYNNIHTYTDTPTFQITWFYVRNFDDYSTLFPPYRHQHRP